jgi:hypothetical protein
MMMNLEVRKTPLRGPKELKSRCLWSYIPIPIPLPWLRSSFVTVVAMCNEDVESYLWCIENHRPFRDLFEYVPGCRSDAWRTSEGPRKCGAFRI